LRLQAIHRVVEGLSLADALAAADPVFTIEALDDDLEAALAALHGETRAHPFVLTDGSACWLLTAPDEQVVATIVGQLAAALIATGATMTTLVLVGEALRVGGTARSHLYDPAYTHTYRLRSADGTTSGRASRRT